MQGSIIHIIDPGVMSPQDVKRLFESLSAENKLKLLEEVFASLSVELKTSIAAQILGRIDLGLKVLVVSSDLEEMGAEWDAYIQSASDTELSEMMIALAQRMRNQDSDR